MLNIILKNLKEDTNIIVYSDGQVDIDNKTLYSYVKRIYNYILKNQKTKTPIIVYGHKSIYMIASFLACSFAGIAYVPIDITLPKDRFDDILEEINPEIIIASEELEIKNKNVLNRKNIEDICKNESYDELDIDILMNKEDIYYIIFTSGSTRKTKRCKNNIWRFKYIYKLVWYLCNSM